MGIGDLSVDQVLEDFANDVGLGAPLVIRDRRDGERHFGSNSYTEVDHFAAHGSASLLSAEVLGELLDVADARIQRLAVADLANRAEANPSCAGDLAPFTSPRIKFREDELVYGFAHGLEA